MLFGKPMGILEIDVRMDLRMAEKEAMEMRPEIPS